MNKNRILFRRGENSSLVNNTDLIPYGQPSYNLTKNYLSVGSEQETQYKNLKPLKVMELFGFFDDLETIKETNENRFFKITGNGSELQIEVFGKDEQNKNNVSISAINNGSKLVLLDSSGHTIIPNQLKVSTITTTSGDLSILANGTFSFLINRKMSTLNNELSFIKPIRIENDDNSTLITPLEISTNSFISSGLSIFNSAKINQTLDVLKKSTFEDADFKKQITSKGITNVGEIKTDSLIVENSFELGKINQDNYRITIDSNGDIIIKGNVKIDGKLTVNDLDV